MVYKEISEMADRLQEKLSACRRDLHRHGETGWLEMRTSSLIAARLKKMGYEVLTGDQVCRPEARMGLPSKELFDQHYQWALEHGADKEYLERAKDGHTGVIGILCCGEGPTVALRFDMDALNVFEDGGPEHLPAREGFCSVTEGTMHACGHDGHMTIGLGTAELLMQFKDRLSGTIKLIFQPAEEGVRGARSIVEMGHLDDVDYVMASHLSASADGRCYVCPGMAKTFATTKLDACFTGKAVHAGVCPQNGKNALMAAATAVLNIQAIPRHENGSSRVNVGTLHAGTGRNVVCDRAKMEIEVRGETTEINDYMEASVRRILQGCADMYECGLEITTMGSAAAIQCTEAFTERIARVCREKLHMDVRPSEGMGASEDFAYMTKRVIELGKNACFTGIHIPCRASFHNRSFDFDERALALGVKFYTGVVWDLLGDGED